MIPWTLRQAQLNVLKNWASCVDNFNTREEWADHVLWSLNETRKQYSAAWRLRRFGRRLAAALKGAV